MMDRLDYLRERRDELAAIHASLGPTHQGWSLCDCSLAKLLRERAGEIAKIVNGRDKKKF